MILPKVGDPRFITIRSGGTLKDADHRICHIVGHPITRLLIDDRFTVETWWRTGGIESTLGKVFETSFTCFERGTQIVIQMLEGLSHEKSYCA
jgi:hypothetical protein